MAVARVLALLALGAADTHAEDDATPIDGQNGWETLRRFGTEDLKREVAGNGSDPALPTVGQGKFSHTNRIAEFDFPPSGDVYSLHVGADSVFYSIVLEDSTDSQGVYGPTGVYAILETE